MRLTILLLIIPLFSMTAQIEADSVRKKAVKAVTTRFPSTRFLDFQYEQFSPGDYDADLYGKLFEKGTLKSQKRFKAALNAPIIRKQKWTFSGSLRYKSESLEFENYENFSTIGTPIIHTDNENFHFYSTGLNFTYYSKLFGKTFVYNASVIAEGSNGGFERINGVLIGSFVLKKTEQTTLTLGMLLQTNNTSIFPVLPTFTFEHRFSNSKWSLDIVLPKYVYMRRPLLDKGRISLGVAFDNESFFVYPHQSGLKEVYQFNRNEIKSGFIYEYMLSKNFITTLKGGLNSTLQGNLRERGATNEIMIVKQDMNGYFNIGISFNPFQSK
ncbi:DUF6268 family outer membrane beta-barrel protein [Flavobacterium sp. HJJ]|uniref:DUF6268 family outer membrane beta-barrel protein n=1 Tax=Flavobacterium sp. HJJ TaxID=2783792 RepID=UPI00188C965A|nr:hypothetical protein [Flavobacterium sp. HJJ]MBF4472119.1 hypothetical protein [Flavobacterium sp. HJJ]